MKFAITLTVVMLTVCSIDKSAAVPKRESRAISREKCPENSTAKECFEYVTEISQQYRYCHRFLIQGQDIEWQSCGTVSCVGDDLEKVPEDINKPYPDCCERCQTKER